MKKWSRRQNYRKMPFWVWQEYEISKLNYGDITIYSLIHIDFPCEASVFDTLSEAKQAAKKRRNEVTEI